jgi:hypothetical protein
MAHSLGQMNSRMGLNGCSQDPGWGGSQEDYIQQEPEGVGTVGLGFFSG